MNNILFAGLIAVWGSGAMAHSPLKQTTPTHDSIVAEMPSEVHLDFNGEIRLTRVTISVTDQDGVDIDLTNHKGFASDYALPLPSMGTGTYSIDWRGLGTDGHAMKGTFNFTVE